MSGLSFFYQLQHVDYTLLSNRDYELGVIDDDDADLTGAQIASLRSQDKPLWSYVSAGEAASFRDYWIQGNWGTNPPSFIIEQNPDWASGWRVKFWEQEWKDIVIDRAQDQIRKGYAGVYLDVVDVYNAPAVRAAYEADHPGGDIAHEMEQFIIQISAAVKSIDPNARVVVQNAVGLLSNTPVNQPTDPLDPNLDYIAAIDGVGKESTFSLGDVFPISWGPYDARYVDNLLSVPGKFVIGLEYPTTAEAQAYSLEQMVAAGYVPYFDNRQHNGGFLEINYHTSQYISAQQWDLLKDAPGLTGNDAGNTLIGTSGNDLISGNGGNDILYGLDGNDTIHGGTGNDKIYGWNGDDYLTGGIGHDSIYADWGNDTVYGGDGNDYIYGWDGADLLYGEAGNDVLYADLGNDTVYCGAGDDIVYGADGADSIQGADGNDFIYGDGGNDTITGDGGNDRLYGWTGNDKISGGEGNDAISGDAGADTLDGGAGDDTIYAGADSDSVTGGGGRDWMFLDGGNDTAYGGDGNDIIFAWEGNDVLYGQGGNDFISAEQGNDTIVGGAGNDELYGGAGADRFVISKGDGYDTIRDFTHGSDLIQLTGFTGNFAQLVAANAYYANGNVTIALTSTQSLTIDNIAVGGLVASDFLIA